MTTSAPAVAEICLDWEEASSWPFLGARRARRDIGAVASTTTPLRASIVGTAGSGKTLLLRQLEERLRRCATPVTVFDAGTDVRSVSREDVLVVDDLHLLDLAHIDALSARAADPDAPMVVASRPWPQTEETAGLLRALGRGASPILLGQVSRSDVLSHLEESGLVIPRECVDQLLTMTSGTAWLMSLALAAHDERDCVDDPTHAAVGRLLGEQVMHRLSTVSDSLRRMIETVSCGPPDHGLAEDLTGPTDELAARGYAEGLLRLNGNPPPVVRVAVCRSLPTRRIVEMAVSSLDGLAQSAAEGDEDLRTWLGGIKDSRLSAALTARADEIVDSDPLRAGELYRAALSCEGGAVQSTVRQALAAWGAGDLDAVAGFVDTVLGARDGAAHAGLSDAVHTAASVWAARGMMATGSDIYAAVPACGRASAVRAALTHVGVGRVDRWVGSTAGVGAGEAAAGVGVGEAAADLGGMRRPTVPSTLGIAVERLGSGLRSSLTQEPPASTLTDLVRASELYTSSHATDPLPELPAVIAAIVAIGAGDLSTAWNVMEAAVTGRQGGTWARGHLLLWFSWVALQKGRPVEARRALAQAEELSRPLSPRDEMLHQAVVVTLARRYGDLPAVEAAWIRAQERVRHIEADLYLLLPISSLIDAAARVGDGTTLAPHLTRGLDILGQLGEPPLWSPHLRWAGIQQGILLNQPTMLGPHARALVAAAPHSHVAQTMAEVGQTWVSVLGGKVDPEGVEDAARALGLVGLAWDGARIASHGASRTQDRKAAARLLACARELQPQDVSQRAVPATDPTQRSGGSAPSDAPGTSTAPLMQVHLSARELDVAHLVLQGKTYVEIGQTIFISPRTVEHHVARIRRRLGATSRSDLIARLRPVVESAPTTPSRHSARSAPHPESPTRPPVVAGQPPMARPHPHP